MLITFNKQSAIAKTFQMLFRIITLTIYVKIKIIGVDFFSPLSMCIYARV